LSSSRLKRKARTRFSSDCHCYSLSPPSSCSSTLVTCGFDRSQAALTTTTSTRILINQNPKRTSSIRMAQLGQKKSRKGCTRCKQRRVKCDEEAPCGNCMRRNEECSLLEPSPSSSEINREPGVPVDTEEWLADLELMHHYASNAASIGKNFSYMAANR
jgi:hypothetical protein